ncbi:MAG: lipopolysaccharide biosynthesis protein, partial [Flavobacteriales bacterium]
MDITGSNHKKIAKNTLLLYFRMMLTMAVSLYTVRVVLNTLGVEDYGIYNVVGGIVTTFSFLSSTMASASQRFFAFELGRKDYVRLKNIFSISTTIYAGIAICIFLLAESVGLWVLNHKLIIPADRMDAANWIYQFSIFSFMLTIMTLQLDAIIMAREHMAFYAYVSIFEVVLKLAIVYGLVLFEMDKLKLYAVLTFFATLFIRLLYYLYCKKRFAETRYTFFWDKPLFKELVGYSGWNLFGTLTSITFNQGVNLLLNVFFGPAVNASRGIAYQINNAVASFSNNFYSAVRPQIIKSYAEDKVEQMVKLVFNTTRYSFYLLMLLSMPLLLATGFFLKLWLNIVPEHAEKFAQLTILFSLINLLQIPISTAVHATGKIKRYQFIIGIIMLLCLPMSYVALKLGSPPEIAFVMMIVVSIVALGFRLVILKELIYFKYTHYIKQVL